MPLNNKYLKYSPEITLEIFTLVYNKLIEGGWKSVHLEENYRYFVEKYSFLTNKSKKHFYTREKGHSDLEGKTETTVQEILGYDPFIKEVIIPEYVECVKQMAAFDLVKIYKTEAYSYGGYRVLRSDGGGQTIKGYEDSFKTSTKEAFDAQNQPLKQAVHCTSQEEWDFVSRKMNSLLKWDSKNPCRILSLPRWSGDVKFCEKENIQILSFQEWEDLNEYKMENKCKFEVGDWVCFTGKGLSIITDTWKPGRILQITCITGNILDFRSCSNHIDGFRHATTEEINNHLTGIGQILHIDKQEPEKYPFKKLNPEDLEWKVKVQTPYYGVIFQSETTPMIKHKMILSIDDEDIPMVNIIKTKTVTLLNNN